MQQEPIHIVFCVNDKYVPYIAVTIKSITENHSGSRIYMYLLTDGVSDSNQQMLYIAKSVCFAARAKWLSKTVDEYGERLSESFWFETMLYDAVEKSAELRIKTCFPIICGINGTHNRQYNYPSIVQRK